ncbi:MULTISPECIES: S53 family peptidase [Burkholderia]|uniref:Peptidase S53 n=1 Tax=Burkholderia diffusa TaxID=488732 RepID=A0A6P2IT21_9BURK|nr:MULTISPECIES: S53 family peptidase [Burkholderia]AOI95711.1 peptidase S53 [Burkholderia sp. LA-2-3-30-S1-D2]KAB0657459.1 S8/S53 family peptidase [Burkholderia diffusa]KVE16346.1 peptidase S53 [Burkholderia sp. LA-2-3-30-S1-D2]MBM2652124.1 S8/S53 family peptidase [Burkholderia diffusa]VWB33186.1 peptidase S53 [Burkholderia diffusa]
MNQVADKKLKHIRIAKLAFAAAAAASFGMTAAHAAPAAGWTETRTKGFLPLVQQGESSSTAGAPAASTAAAAAAATEMAPGESVDIVLGLNLRSEAQLDQYLHDLHTPGSPHYKQFLTSAQFAAQYAPTDQQVASVVAHLRQAGFVNIVVAPNRLLVSASGTAATVKSAFRTTLKRFTRNGRNVYANTDAAQVPNAISGIVGAVLGLQNVELMHTGAGSKPQGNTSNLTIPAGASAVPHYPTEFSSLYGGDGTPTASQTTVGIISEGDLSQTVSDLNTFAANNGLGTISSSVVQTGPSGSSYTDTSGTVEWNLDSQSIVGAAGGSVKQVVFYVAPSMSLTAITAAYNKAVSDNVAKVINVSLGVCESSAYSTGSQATDDTIFKQAIAQGQTFSVSAGDHGAYECASGTPSRSTYTVSEPATSPYVIAVGGTTLFTNTSTNAYNSEIVWNDPSWQPGTVWSTGGGYSKYEAAPSWQSSSLTGSTKRALPDVGFDADLRTGAILVVNGQTSDTLWGSGYLNNEGGTSLAAPIFTGIWARLQSANNNALGFPASSIYKYFPSNAALVHDVTSGNNGSGTYGYKAKAGWDATTGFGSVNISKLNTFIQSTSDFAR